MAKELLERLCTKVSRRTAVGRLLLGSVAFVTGVFGIAPKAYACVACCLLCKDPATCSFSGCGCVWFWSCCDESVGLRYLCRECYTAAPPCTCCACGSVKCSGASVSGSCGG